MPQQVRNSTQPMPDIALGDIVRQQQKKNRSRNFSKSSREGITKVNNKRARRNKRQTASKDVTSDKAMINKRRNDAPGTKLKVINLHYDIPEHKLLSFFSQKGKVNRIDLLRDPKGRSNGICFVTYANHSDAMNAVREYHNHVAMGRSIMITVVGQRQGATRDKKTVEVLDAEIDAYFATKPDMSAETVKSNNIHENSVNQENTHETTVQQANKMDKVIDEMDAFFDEVWEEVHDGKMEGAVDADGDIDLMI